jgi:hypothetical protein
MAAERFVEGALKRCQPRRRYSLYAQKGPNTPQLEPVLCNPFYIGRLARLELRPLGVRCRRKKAPGWASRTNACLLRHLSRGRRRIGHGSTRRGASGSLADRSNFYIDIAHVERGCSQVPGCAH